MATYRKRGQPHHPGGWPKSGDVTAEDVARLRAETAAEFGEDAAAAVYDTLGGPLPPEVREGLRDALGPGMPTVDDFLASHDELRALVGDKRSEPTNSPQEPTGQGSR